MKIETNRLELVALNDIQFDLLINNTKKLENNLNCIYKAEPIIGFFKEILLQQLNITKQDKENYVWHSFWLIIRKEDRIVVGLIDFKDVPNKYGEVEIGYGLGKQFEKNGYMTETVKEICKFAFSNKNVKHVIAETDLDGIASQNNLKKCGFKKYSENETCWWKL